MNRHTTRPGRRQAALVALVAVVALAAVGCSSGSGSSSPGVHGTPDLPPCTSWAGQHVTNAQWQAGCLNSKGEIEIAVTLDYGAGCAVAYNDVWIGRVGDVPKPWSGGSPKFDQLATYCPPSS